MEYSTTEQLINSSCFLMNSFISILCALTLLLSAFILPSTSLSSDESLI